MILYSPEDKKEASCVLNKLRNTFDYSFILYDSPEFDCYLTGEDNDRSSSSTACSSSTSVVEQMEEMETERKSNDDSSNQYDASTSSSKVEGEQHQPPTEARNKKEKEEEEKGKKKEKVSKTSINRNSNVFTAAYDYEGLFHHTGHVFLLVTDNFEKAEMPIFLFDYLKDRCLQYNQVVPLRLCPKVNEHHQIIDDWFLELVELHLDTNNTIDEIFSAAIASIFKRANKHKIFQTNNQKRTQMCLAIMIEQHFKS